ncbi:MAG: PIG-L family deacetylase [Gemmatimonadetes bacterium]|nr:PIG-L family deacetylase [Gemmatimonadota bacterium]NIR77870.1 PIG-L family deacetylase [Gemmatimonadota bacterium]NIT86415.1 PIG-L family deacetylase [Gemmatimonadota bacterium]NIU30252.1 PIG-L family deacetylase [Gemmatimonadota bacterium]NIU35158.1 PIG-L family deacetylase [Gemmatimonadota bacterium]
MGERTLLVALAHPDDEVAAAGTILSQRARGDRVVVLWLTRGEMTEAFGPLPPDEVAERREALGAEAGRILGVETRFLDFPDTRVQATPGAAARVARILADVRPDGILTWGAGWVRGTRHPDHQATGKICRDAVTLARIAKVVEPLEPHRSFCPVFTFRDLHSPLPAVAVDVEAHLGPIYELARLYRREVGFGEREWLERRLREVGGRWGVGFAEEFDAWETGSGLVDSLLPPTEGKALHHPERDLDPVPDS